MQLSKELGCQYRTAWHMLHHVHEARAGGDSTLYKIVEKDEMYINGKERNKHDSKKHLARYVNEAAFRHDEGDCEVDTLNLIAASASGIGRKRLHYQDLVV